jgi:hypothetical protein
MESPRRAQTQDNNRNNSKPSRKEKPNQTTMKSVQFGEPSIIIEESGEWSSRDQSWWTPMELGESLREQLQSQEIDFRGLETLFVTEEEREQCKQFVTEVIEKYKRLKERAEKLGGSTALNTEAALQRFASKYTKQSKIKAKVTAKTDAEEAEQVYIACLDALMAFDEAEALSQPKVNVVESRSCHVI